MRDLIPFLQSQYEAELQAFRTSLEGVPEEAFGVGRLGHAPAWHALHIADWLRLVVLDDRTPNYHFLGWEDNAQVQALGAQPARLEEQAGKAAVLARLDEVGGRALAALSALTPADLSGTTFSPTAPGQQRPRLQALGLHLRHIGYHRGQVQLLKKVNA